jgi:glucokinase
MYIGIDIGGSNTRVGVFPSLDSPDFSVLVKFPTQQDYDRQLRYISDALQGYAGADIAGIGISVAGRVARDGRSVDVAPNLPGYVGRPFAQDVSGHFGCPVRLAHDTVCGLLAEKQFGSLRADDRCAYLTVSTGTGAAFQLRKDAASPPLTVSIEIGHQLLDGNSRRCLCGQTGCLETYTGGRQLELRYGRPLEQISDEAFWEQFSEKLALGLLNLAMLTRVETVAVSGAIALNRPTLLEQVQRQINARIRGAALTLRMASLREDAPLVGAAVLLTVPEETIVH